MKLSTTQLEKIKKILIKENLHFTEDESDLLSILDKKHYERFIDLIRWLKKLEIRITDKILSRVYRTDVIIRQELQILLGPIELELATKISNFCEFNLQKFDKDKIMKILFDEDVLESFDDIKDRRLVMKRANTQLWLEDSIRKILHKHNSRTNSYYGIFAEMSFGQKTAFLTLLDEKVIQKILETNKTKIEIIKIFQMIAASRNHIAHLNTIINTRGIQIEGRKEVFQIKDFIVQLNNITEWQATTVFKERIESYFVRYMNKIKCDCDEYCKKGVDCEKAKTISDDKRILEMVNTKMLEFIL